MATEYTRTWILGQRSLDTVYTGVSVIWHLTTEESQNGAAVVRDLTSLLSPVATLYDAIGNPVFTSTNGDGSIVVVSAAAGLFDLTLKGSVTRCLLPGSFVYIVTGNVAGLDTVLAALPLTLQSLIL